MKVREYINKIKEQYKLVSDEQLAVKIGVSKASIDKWIQRNKVPDKWIVVLGQYVLEEDTNIHKILIPNQINSHISNIELEILEAYRELPKVDQEIFYFRIKGAAAEARKKSEELHGASVEDVKSAG